MLKSAEDSESSSIYSSFERFMRVIGVFLAIYLPAFWVAITTYHQNQLPMALLAPVVESRRVAAAAADRTRSSRYSVAV
ncbi:spore germination protein [Terrilactibacillus sp. S3-3]|nr:spore germination protein [Terrilactibacillus sp. S3-3]